MLPSLLVIWLQCIPFSWFCQHLLTFPSTSCHNVGDQSTQSLSQRSHSPLPNQLSLLFWFGFSPHTTASTTPPQGSTAVPHLGYPWPSSSPLPQIITLLFALLRTSSHFSCSQNTHLCLTIQFSHNPTFTKCLLNPRHHPRDYEAISWLSRSCYSNCGPWTSSTGVANGHIRNVNSQALPQVNLKLKSVF